MNIYAKTDDVILQEIGERIKETRVSKKLSQKELADAAGVQRVLVSRIENGSNFNLATLIKLLRALSKLEDLDKLLDIEKDKELLKLFE
ncbi:MAG: helix-turn-helix domain-containing protein [Chitinophagales bacterium]